MERYTGIVGVSARTDTAVIALNTVLVHKQLTCIDSVLPQKLDCSLRNIGQLLIGTSCHAEPGRSLRHQAGGDAV